MATIPQNVSRKPAVKYVGKRAKIGNSQGFRVEKAFFRSHPEFDGNVTFEWVGPRQVLVTAEPEEHEDPVLSAFLDLLAKDMDAHPERIRPLSEEQMREVERLTEGMVFDPDEDLGEEDLLA